MPVYIDKNKARWRFTFNRIIGSQRVRATKLLAKGWSRTQAESYDRKETARLYALATGIEQPEPTIGQAVALYLDHRVPRLRNAKGTAKDLAFLTEYIEGVPMSKLADAARSYEEDHPHLAAATIRKRLAYLKAACRYAWKKRKLTQHDPTDQLELPVVNNTRDVQIPVERLLELLDAIEDDESRALFTLAFRVGSRWISNVHPRRPEDVERVGKDVWLRVGMTKNGTPRMKWVHPAARWALSYLPFEHTPKHYYGQFCKAREKVGLDALPGKLGRLTAHDMRHVVATDIRKRGGSLGDVGAALDHDSYQASQRYAHITSPHVKRVLSQVGQRSKMHTPRKRRMVKKAA